jgi:hypothetical protein
MTASFEPHTTSVGIRDPFNLESVSNDSDEERPAVSSRMSEMTSEGLIRASLMAIHPPIELPAMVARGILRDERNSSTLEAWRSTISGRSGEE